MKLAIFGGCKIRKVLLASVGKFTGWSIVYIFDRVKARGQISRSGRCGNRQTAGKFRAAGRSWFHSGVEG